MATFNTALTTASVAHAPASSERANLTGMINTFGEDWASLCGDAGLSERAFQGGQEKIQLLARDLATELRDET